MARPLEGEGLRGKEVPWPLELIQGKDVPLAATFRRCSFNNSDALAGKDSSVELVCRASGSISCVLKPFAVPGSTSWWL